MSFILRASLFIIIAHVFRFGAFQPPFHYTSLLVYSSYGLNLRTCDIYGASMSLALSFERM
jgi:hypothetical protein